MSNAERRLELEAQFITTRDAAKRRAILNELSQYPAQDVVELFQHASQSDPDTEVQQTASNLLRLAQSRLAADYERPPKVDTPKRATPATTAPPAHWPSPEAFVVAPESQLYLRGDKRALVPDWMSLKALFFALLVLVGAASLLYGVQQMNAESAGAVNAQATLVEKRIVQDAAGNINGYLWVLEHVYNERTYRDQVLVPSWQYDQAQPPQAIPVRFQPAQPDELTLSAVAAQETNGFLLLSAGIAALTLVTMAVLLVLRARRLRLAYEGQFVRGIITDSWIIRWFTLVRLEVEYQFTSPQTGRILKGKRFSRRDGFSVHQSTIDKGMPVVVVYRNDQHYLVL